MSAESPVDTGDDPRLHTGHVRHLSGDSDERAATLVGVVHDHPASRYRVGELAVAPLALPLFDGDAAAERSQLSRRLILLRCADPSEPIRSRDDVRDRCMAARLDDSRAEGDVVAVVGRGHLDPLAERLTN